MAGKKCPQCAETVKAEALVCRFCGNKFPAPAPKQPMSTGKKMLIAFGGLVFVAMVGGRPVANGSKAVETVATSIPSSSPTDDLPGLAIMAGASLKKSARDPDSLVIDRAFGLTEKHGVAMVCIDYRARNGFGGMNRDHVVFSLAGGDQSSRSWNKYCTGNAGYEELTASVSTGTSMSVR